MKQIAKAAEADAEAAVEAATGVSSTGTSSGEGGEQSYTSAPAESGKAGGSLASDEQLAALREKLSGGA